MSVVKNDDIKMMIEVDLDYIASKRFGCSVAKLMERHPEGCPDRVIAAALLMTEEELETRYVEIVKRLRTHMGVEE